MKTILNLIRNNIIIILLSITGISLFVISCNLLPNMGYIKDENPTLVIPAFFPVMEWVMLITSFLITITGIVIWIFSSKRKQFCLVAFILIILVGVVFGYSQIEFSKFIEKNKIVKLSYASSKSVK